MKLEKEEYCTLKYVWWISSHTEKKIKQTNPTKLKKNPAVSF